MDTRFTPHNRQWESAEAFWREDPHLKQLQRQPLVYRSPLIDRLPRARPGIFTVTGGRQTGKTTLLKQWMGELLHAKLTTTALLFLTGELIDDHHSLVRLLTEVLPEMFSDPFIFHAMHNWLHPCADPFAEQIEATLGAPTEKARLVEASAVTQVRRWHPTFHIKSKGEVDIAYVSQGRFWPIEIKWTGQLRPKDLQQAAKYPNSMVFGRQRGFGKINGMPTEPLPWALFRLGMEKLQQ